MPDVYAVIVRVSHMGARRSGAEDFHSERDQIRAATAAVEGVGGIPELLPSELDVSGGKTLAERPSLNQAVEGIEQGKYAGLVVAYHSRLARDPEVEEQVFRRVEAAGGRVLMALDPVDNSTVDGRLLRRVRSSFHAAERERHVVRFDELRRSTVRDGIWQRRQVPTGYVKDPTTRKLTPSPKADDVRWAFRARAGGTSALMIAERLGMTPSGVRQLLRNRVYLGELKVGEYVNPEAHPALVTVEEWEAAQVTVPRPPRSKLPPALLAGIVRCQACGHVMTRRVTKQVIYACPRWHSGGECPEPAGIGAHLLEPYVEQIALAELAQLKPEASAVTGDLDVARDAVARAERELAAYLEAISVDDVGPEAFAKGARTRRVAVEDAKGELHRLMAVAPAAPAYGGAVDVWEDLDAHERNAVLRALLEAVVVRRAGRPRVPIADRVRVVAFGTGLVPERTGAPERGYGIVPIAWPDIDDPGVLRMLGGEDGL